MSQAILTEAEAKEYITRIMLAFRRNLSQQMEASGEPLETTSDFNALLYELTEWFELDPGQQTRVCGSQVCLLYNSPVGMHVARQLAFEPLVAQPLVAFSQGAQVCLAAPGRSAGGREHTV